MDALKMPLSYLHFAVDFCNSFVANNYLTFICKIHCIYLYITSNISVQCCVRHNHPKWIYMQINFNKTYSVLFLQLGIPLIFVPSISQPSVSTHQQYPVEGWHCTSSKLPSSLHCGIYRPGIGVPEIWVKKFQNLTKVNTRGCKWVTAPKQADQYSKFNDYPFYSTVLELNLAAVKSPHPWPSFLPSFLLAAHPTPSKQFL